MGTGNSKKEKQEKDKDYMNKEKSKEQQLSRPQLKFEEELKKEMQPLRSKTRKKNMFKRFKI